MNKLLIIIIVIVAFIFLILVLGKINLSLKFKNQVRQLFSESKNIAEEKFNYKKLEGLPEPVQRYFKFVLKENQPYISYVRLKHNGKFKTNLKKSWIDITGEQYFTAEKPGFIWKGKTAMFVARDMYISNEGRLTATLFSIYNVVDVHGKKQYNESELLRWLSESVWFPTNLLPSKRLHWFPIDANSAKLTFEYEGLSLFYIITFNEKGEIIQMETERFMDETRKETWIINPDQYEEINGVTIPMHAEVFWRLKEGDFSYASFYVQKIEYDQPEQF